MLTLHWRAPEGQYGHLVKLSCERGSPLGMHTHNFPEVFWIVEGPCLHRINGREESLQPGDVCFIRAGDRHQLCTLGRRRFTLANLECQPELVKALCRRLPEPFARWFGSAGVTPCRHRLSDAGLHRLERMGLDFAAGPADALHTESFLLDLAKLCARPRQSVVTGADCPGWLRDGLLKAEEPEVFGLGVSGFVAATARSAAHVTRSCVRFTGKTPTEIIEAVRMRWAERQLRLTNESVTEIALACGYGSPAQFYRAFLKTYGRTPLRYRRWLLGVNRKR